MTIDEMREVISQCKYADYEFLLGEKNGVLYLQGRYLEPDIVTGDVTDQHTRKWMLSEHMVPSDRHFDIEALHEIARARRL